MWGMKWLVRILEVLSRGRSFSQWLYLLLLWDRERIHLLYQYPSEAWGDDGGQLPALSRCFVVVVILCLLSPAALWVWEIHMHMERRDLSMKSACLLAPFFLLIYTHFPLRHRLWSAAPVDNHIFRNREWWQEISRQSWFPPFYILSWQ